MTSRVPDFDYDRLSEYLKALSNPNRLELLYQLRFPRTASEVTLTPKRNESEGNPDRLISRQAVERHLSVLEEIGVVRAQRAARDGRPVDEFVVNHASLFAIVEELKKLATIKAQSPIDPLATSGVEAIHLPPPPAAERKGPVLVLVAGVYEGRTYSLASEGGRDAAWLIGRRDGADVRLDYDPFVSSENTRVVLADGRFLLEDVATSRNGTQLNYAPVERGARALLETGDLIGVGRSLLLFRSVVGRGPTTS